MSASLEREDGLHEKLQSQEPLQVHIACRKAYTRTCINYTTSKRVLDVFWICWRRDNET